MIQHDQLRTIMTEGDHLDDITRARMWSRIESSIEKPERERVPSRRRAAGLAIAAIAAAAAVILIVRAVRSPAREGELAVAADATLTTRLGPHARVALVGPARLELIGSAGDATTARLHAGTLLAEFEGGPGRSLRIEAGELVVEVVGTLFSIEVHDDTACVAVSHGTVRVTQRGAVRLVTDHQQLCSSEATPHAIPDAIETQLEHHERSLASPTTALATPAPARTESAPQAPATTNVGAPTAPTGANAVPRATAVMPATSIATRADERTAPPPTAQGPSTPPPAEVQASATAPEPTAPPAAPPPAPVQAPDPLPTAESLYHAAEVALAAGDRAAADRALARLLELPGTTLVDQALYERARIAYQDRAYAVARRHLAKLAKFVNTPLAEPGSYLDCRIAVQARDADAERCLVAYRTAYPQSPHDLDVLAVLAQLAHARGGCDAARSVRDELVTRYPRTDHAAAWRARCPEAR